MVYNMTWGEYLRHLYNLSLMLEDQCPFIRTWKGVYGPPRGGLIPAVYLSHQLGIPLVETVPKLPYEARDRSLYLVVDDICDSGKTLIPYYGWFTATLVARPETLTNVDLAMCVIEDWVVFPYER